VSGSETEVAEREHSGSVRELAVELLIEGGHGQRQLETAGQHEDPVGRQADGFEAVAERRGRLARRVAQRAGRAAADGCETRERISNGEAVRTRHAPAQGMLTNDFFSSALPSASTTARHAKHASQQQ
jgi:hypothetical protein